MYHPTTRVLTVLELLQSNQRLSGPELAARLEVDVRTVRNYIIMLQDLGVPIETQRGRHGAYRLRPGYKLPPLMFTDDEAMALTLGLLAAQKLGLAPTAPAIEGALAKVERVLPLALKERVQAVQESVVFDLVRSGITPTSGIVVLLSIALQKGRRIKIRYLSSQAEKTERTIDLYGLVCRGGFWYAVGYCHLRTDVRMFRVDRVLDAEMLDETYTRPTAFDPLEYVLRSLAATPPTWSVEVLLKTTFQEARRLVPSTIGVIEQVPDGVILRCSLAHLEWFAHFLAGLRCRLVVLHPPELRVALQQLAEEVAQMAAANI